MSKEAPESMTTDLNDTLYDPGSIEAHLGVIPTQPPGVIAGPRSTILPKIRIRNEQPEFFHECKTRYEIIQEIGQGGEGEIFKAIDQDIGRMVALKRLRGQKLLTQASILRFVEEIRTTGRLEHPNIVPVHDVGVDDKGSYYFIMKLVEGETLESIISRLAAGDPDYHHRFGFERRMQIFHALLEAVAYAHSKGYIHRDIKPANVMVGAFGETLLMDWGIARQLEEGGEFSKLLDETLESDQEDVRVFETQTGVVVGTPAYMAPEQTRGQVVDARADIYSLCVLLHEFMTLEHYLLDRRTLIDVLVGVTTVPINQAYQSLNPYQDRVPPDISWFIQAGVSKEIEARYPSVEAMLARLLRRNEGNILVQCPLTATKQMMEHWIHFINNHPLIAFGLFSGLALLFLLSLLRQLIVLF